MSMRGGACTTVCACGPPTPTPSAAAPACRNWTLITELPVYNVWQVNEDVVLGLYHTVARPRNLIIWSTRTRRWAPSLLPPLEADPDEMGVMVSTVVPLRDGARAFAVGSYWSRNTSGTGGGPYFQGLWRFNLGAGWTPIKLLELQENDHCYRCNEGLGAITLMAAAGAPGAPARVWVTYRSSGPADWIDYWNGRAWQERQWEGGPGERVEQLLGVGGFGAWALVANTTEGSHTLMWFDGTSWRRTVSGRHPTH